ncbi:unnamed protein product [Microthlaspi erraticum]|uniref:Pentatricopeptide repeat-containing protein n=1 Tax=Microthlaspi erraticum TaxID=1685480 RepID=A0A6D2I7A5_9BRAS|nr:unnamed protein product [Microthlaspi erraticum]
MLSRVWESESSSSAAAARLIGTRLVHRRVAQKGSIGYHPDIITYGTIVNGMCKVGDTVSILMLLKTFSGDDFSRCVLDIVTLNILLEGLCNHGKVEKALEMFKVMQKSKMDLNTAVYNIIIMECARIVRWTKHGTYSLVFPSMGDAPKGVVPNTITYNSMVEGLCKQSRLDEAKQMIDSMASEGCSPDVVTFNTLINGYCKAGRVDNSWSFSERCI